MIYRYFPPHLVVKDGIHGVGVFTTMNMKRGTTLFKMKGEILPKPTRTSVQIGDNQHIEDEISGHVNHACTPNTIVDRTTRSFVSLRDIEEGEELTFDYTENEDSMAAPFICECCGKEISGMKKREKSVP